MSEFRLKDDHQSHDTGGKEFLSKLEYGAHLKKSRYHEKDDYDDKTAKKHPCPRILDQDQKQIKEKRDQDDLYDIRYMNIRK